MRGVGLGGEGIDVRILVLMTFQEFPGGPKPQEGINARTQLKGMTVWYLDEKKAIFLLLHLRGLTACMMDLLHGGCGR